MKVKPIARIEQLSFEEFQHEFAIQNQPVIISGAAKDWAACSLWSPETFKTMFGNVLAPLRGSDNEIDVFFGEDNQKTVLSIAEYIDLIVAIPPDKRPPYLGNISFNDPLAKPHLDTIKPHIKFPNYFPVNRGMIFIFGLGLSNKNQRYTMTIITTLTRRYLRKKRSYCFRQISTNYCMLKKLITNYGQALLIHKSQT